jgi:hypothetical protein
VVAVVSLLLLLVGAAGASASSNGQFHYCLYPTVAEGVVSDLSHITVPRACKVVRKFVTWLNAKHGSRLARCVGSTPVLKVHSFDRYHLSISEYRLVMSRGRSRFAVSGYDGWPIPCGPLQ